MEAEDGGGDETQERDEREKDNMLIAGPAERVLGLHQFKKSVEGECSQNEEEGDKHRRKKYINHSTANRRDKSAQREPLGSERRCKGRYKK